MAKSLGAFVLIVFCSFQSLAGESCAHLKGELKSLQKAQQALMMSLVNNHESFATTLEEYAVQPSSKAMLKSASAFRKRGLQGKELVAELNSATGDLVSRISECL